MDIRVFAPLDGVSALEDLQLGKVQAQSVQFTEKLYEPGSFTMALSGYGDYVDALRQGNLLRFRFQGHTLWGIIRGVENTQEGNSIPLVRSGDDLKGYLKQRVCLYPQEGAELAGYDTVKGSTETVMKHYVQNNLVSPVGEGRKIPGFAIAPDLGRGNPDDRYMARFQRVDDLLREVGSDQKLGYQVAMDQENSRMLFDVVEVVNRTAGQDVRPRIVFDVNLRTAKGSRFVSDTENYRNAFYTTKSGAASEGEATTLLFYREGETPQGIGRYETQISVDVDAGATDIPGEMENLARQEMTSFERDDSFTIDLSGGYVYGRDFFLGDFVTIQDTFLGQREDVQLIQVTHEWNGIGYRITGEFGKPRKTNLQLLERQLRTGGK